MQRYDFFKKKYSKKNREMLFSKYLGKYLKKFSNITSSVTQSIKKWIN